MRDQNSSRWSTDHRHRSWKVGRSRSYDASIERANAAIALAATRSGSGVQTGVGELSTSSSGSGGS
jgi:hypothetical protein